MLAHDMAVASGGRFLLRIEDTDIARSKPEWETQIYDDLAWLGLSWETPVLRQSEHLSIYNDHLMRLAGRGLIYPCSCSRSDIRNTQSAPQEGAPVDADIYPGTCRHRGMSSRKPGDALRLNMARAVAEIDSAAFEETGSKHAGHHLLDPQRLIREIGDAVLGRKELETVSYVLASVIDEAAQNITHVVRGEDLYQVTFLQVLLQHLLDLPTPVYHHHRLIRDDQGKRLAKRDDARAIAKFREDGATPQDIRAMVGLG